MMKSSYSKLRKTGISRTGTLSMSYKEIKSRLFKPNVTDMDDPSKVKASWGVIDKKGRECFIWCYKSPSKKECTSWSIDGNQELLKEIFGAENVSFYRGN